MLGKSITEETICKLVWLWRKLSYLDITYDCTDTQSK